MYNTSLAYIALIRNKNNPNQTINIKFNGGKLVDQPIITDIDVELLPHELKPFQSNHTFLGFFLSCQPHYLIIKTNHLYYYSTIKGGVCQV